MFSETRSILRALFAVFLALSLSLMPVRSASAAAYTLDPAVLVSGPSPFAACPVGAADANSVVYTNTEVEPFVAVNPTNPDNIIGAFQQDRWNDGGAKALTAAHSFDGGVTWTRNSAAFSECSGGDPAFDRTTDPWVSFDADGKAYQIALSIDSAALNISAVLASTSDDGGASWSAPVTIIQDENPVNFNDKESITGDWTRPGYAYATWIRGAIPGENRSLTGLANSFAYRGQPMFSRTTDGGQTWSTPQAMTNQNIYAQGNQIVVLPDGTLVNVFAALFKGAGIQPNNQQVFMAVIRSRDGGLHWSAPVKIAPLGTVLLTDPDTPNPTSLDQTVRAGDYLPDIAVDKTTGAIYVVWADGLGTNANNVVLAKSTDGGRHWSAPQIVDQMPGQHAFNGTVEVTADGTVAVMYYDFRNNTPGGGLPTDVWLTHSHDGGATWSEQHVAGPFDMKDAPVARGYFLGDYHGLAAVGDDLLLFFSTTQGDKANVYSVRARH
ncbi:MAG TPA: sialidase family protein [Anaerolineales bacterium]|nr:sialidase family protein [Anaerolineales bacterium]